MSSKGRGRSTHPMMTTRGRSWKISRRGCGRSMKSGSCVQLSSDSTSCPPSWIEGERSMAWSGGRTPPLPTHLYTPPGEGGCKSPPRGCRGCTGTAAVNCPPWRTPGMLGKGSCRYDAGG